MNLIGETLGYITNDGQLGVRMSPYEIDRFIQNHAIQALAHAGMYDEETHDFTELADKC